MALIFGLDIAVAFERPGYRVARRKIKHNKIGKTHRINAEECQEYMTKKWKSPKDLFGCGKYADDCWHIFCKGDWQSVSPSDHALNKYHDWLSLQNA